MTSVSISEKSVPPGPSSKTATAIDPLAEVVAFAEAVTVLDVSFLIKESFDFEIYSQVSLSIEGAGSAQVAVLFEGPGGTLFSEMLTDFTGGSERLEQGVLDPGEYRLTVAVAAESDGTGVSYGAFLVGVIVPEPATAALVLGALFIVPSRRRRAASC